MYRLICQKPAHFLSAQKALGSTFFQMFIVLGNWNVYNFDKKKKNRGLVLKDITFCDFRKDRIVCAH